MQAVRIQDRPNVPQGVSVSADAADLLTGTEYEAIALFAPVNAWRHQSSRAAGRSGEPHLPYWHMACRGERAGDHGRCLPALGGRTPISCRSR